MPLKEILKKEALLFQDVGHTRTIAAAKVSDRARFCPLELTTAPTVLKSQARRTKDSLYFTDDAGRILFPTVSALKTLHGFGEELEPRSGEQPGGHRANRPRHRPGAAPAGGRAAPQAYLAQLQDGPTGKPSELICSRYCQQLVFWGWQAGWLACLPRAACCPLPRWL